MRSSGRLLLVKCHGGFIGKGHDNGDFMNDTLKTIDALPDLLPCPFCGEWPDRIKDYGVHCLTGDCGMYLKLMNIRDWNRRAASVDRKAIVEEAFERLKVDLMEQLQRHPQIQETANFIFNRMLIIIAGFDMGGEQ